MKKPELLVTPHSVAHVQELCNAGADAFVIGEQRYGLRLAGEFTKEAVKEAVEIAHKHDKKVYVAMNAIFHNDRVGELEDYIGYLASISVDGVIFGDPAVIMAARVAAPTMPLHWNTETTATNWFTCNYWGQKGATRAVLARELSMDAVLEIKENAEVAVEVQVHGMTCMFQSKRTLLGNYYRYQGKTMPLEKLEDSRTLLLYDKERNNKYPIYEDENGTHIMSPNDICMIDELPELVEGNIDSLKVDGVLQTSEYITKVTALYREAIDTLVSDEDLYEEKKGEWLEQIEAMQPEHRPLDTGFFFKETVY
ncbi:peptidase U32 family protein [Mangrovibacillus cuniculi]|uniref:U32 family peptidase n=1 Tax=Mangrovibacillus cuniculi TaxID=2593652 RepID=A0A7S8HFQ5_9BACI|nr:peptidase U32 family protein [Mangrovibacillus cuniculi]QPC46987.1 U32 family peptidase [Mangrovibacillus cuniculi]